jgi:aminopeptidase N
MRLIPVLLASAAFAFAAPVAAQVQADTVDTSIPTQLPRTAVPHHYAVTVTPHADSMTFDGTVSIDLNVVQPTRELTLNAADMSFAKATLTRAGTAPLDASVAMNADAQTATLTFPRQLAPGAYRLTIA